MMEQIIDPSNLCFRTLAVIHFQIIFAIFQKKIKKNQLDASGTGKWGEQTKVVKISEKFMFKLFFDMMEQKIDPQPMFLKSCCNLLSNYFCNFSKKSVGCK